MAKTKEVRLSLAQEKRIGELETGYQNAQAVAQLALEKRNVYLEGLLSGSLTEAQLKSSESFDIKDHKLIVTLVDTQERLH
jgi:hypothetical protein